MKKTNVFVIFGPTSSGKTSLAIKLSQKLNGVIVSADSRQVYKEMNIGTGKLPINSNYNVKVLDEKWLVNDVEIYGYDLVYPNEYFSAYDFYNYAKEVITSMSKKNKTIFLVGGTGFYIDVVTGESFVSGVKPDLELRSQLESKTTEELYKILERLSRKLARRIDKNNRNRIIRAIEITSSFENLKFYEKRQIRSELIKNFNFVYIGLITKRDYLYKRVDLWLETIWQNGLLDETRYLMTKYGNIDKLNGLVYRSAVEFLKKEVSEEEAMQRAKYDLHHYIRRQETWFKRYDKAITFDTENKNYYSQVLNLLQSEYNVK